MLTYAFGVGYFDNWAVVVLGIVLILLYQFIHSASFGMVAFAILCIAVSRWVDQFNFLPLWELR